MAPLRIILAALALCCAPVAAVAQTYTWNNANWVDPARWTLSNGNKTATRAGPTAFIPIKSNESFSSGTVTVDFTITTFDGLAGDGSAGVGLVNGAWTNGGGSTIGDANSLFVETDGTGDANGGSMASGTRLPSNAGISSGNTIRMELSYGAKTVRFSKDAGATWGSTSDITWLTSGNANLYLATWSYNANYAVTVLDVGGGGGGGATPHGRPMKGCC